MCRKGEGAKFGWTLRNDGKTLAPATSPDKGRPFGDHDTFVPRYTVLEILGGAGVPQAHGQMFLMSQGPPTSRGGRWTPMPAWLATGHVLLSHGVVENRSNKMARSTDQMFLFFIA